ncbi:toprim domain-containing protein [Saccharicrinis aurantiacus]|uniref:toprim domain-containing protein n=1 Tax=Saccharicrinis aurantiacus TaxID=1849719 RepID=UPI0009502CA4|nr:toprim domain-containing protein [Saccharicrinis aurantiacus]
MNCNQAKNIPIVSYLKELGFEPCRIYKHNYWFISMIRQNESKASFKVDIKQNCWFDHGLGEGGNILDLVMRLHSLTTISKALRVLSETRNNSSLSFHQAVNKDVIEEKHTYKVKELNNKALLNYITHKRGLSVLLCKRYCEEVYYKMNDKNYFAIGFKSVYGGYELRNKFWKGCIGKKGISIINNGKNECFLFEGFIDFLSFIQLFPAMEYERDYIILNSISMLNEAIKIATNYKLITTFFDNDESGYRASNTIKESTLKSIDASSFYADFKDVNSYLNNNK